MAARIASATSPQCPVCHGEDLLNLLEIKGMPVHCHLLCNDSSTARQAAKGIIQLAFCTHCRHGFNQLFDPELMQYEGDYENSLHGSPTFQNYASQLVQRLIDTYEIRRKSVGQLLAHFTTMYKPLYRSTCNPEDTCLN